MAKEQEERERRWQEIRRRADTVRQVHPARRLLSESDMLWLVDEVQRLRAENEQLERQLASVTPARDPAGVSR